jgi:hypothetical protein
MAALPFMHFFDWIDKKFEYGNYRTADDVLDELLNSFNRDAGKKGLYKDRDGNPLTMQMKFVENFHDLRDIFKLELDIVDFESYYKKLTTPERKKIIDFMTKKLFDLSQTMSTESCVTSDDPELDDICITEKGISISYRIKHAGTDKEEYVVEGYSFPDFQRNHFYEIAKEAKEKAQAMVEEKELHSAMKNQPGG